ncbi:probable BOI-related E3 ubiquitin-protein ligase 2 [Panicum virgatum]|uniref:probable BOI-related E3 ubiquitin-protein ligase 2 n=1 Tax=Panicum virgatum TaxID=38727 RepID=UPI0019D4EF4A|nr:probable BOI-related E3 ubiquitin-protein ligase 2 [Panicum virgatum]
MAVVAAVERAAAEAELDRARCRNAELEEWLQQLAAEVQAWLRVARSHEAVAVGLRATLLQQPACTAFARAGATADDGDAEDTQSCCFETSPPADDAASRGPVPSCRSCGGGGACVLLLCAVMVPAARCSAARRGGANGCPRRRRTSRGGQLRRCGVSAAPRSST